MARDVPTWSHSLDSEPVHAWFGLTYSSYLVVQRSILQSMPLEWQQRFVRCLEEMQDVAPDDVPTNFWIRAHDGKAFQRDPYSNYERGRRKVALKSSPGETHSQGERTSP